MDFTRLRTGASSLGNHTMIISSLVSRTEAPYFIAKAFSAESMEAETNLSIEVNEDKCFPKEWVPIGRITIYPETSDSFSRHTDPKIRMARAIRYGSFSWQVPSMEETLESFESAFGPKTQLTNGQKHQLEQAIKEIPYIAIRCGLTHPIFDAIAVSEMPFARPVSVVADTSAVIQGGLDFVARHLVPQARLKIPAIVHMEILNFSERYFSRRLRRQPTPRMLLDHLRSQGAQRVLLRLENDRRVEIERPRLGADPLRGIVQPDSDREDKNLGLQLIQRSFADRLILETAIQHRETVAPDHAVMLLTSDQGLARMALAEGIQPIFSDTNAVTHVFGTTLSGIVFVPFVRGVSRQFSSSLADVLWEIATSFGSARLLDENTGSTFTVAALQSEVPWQPFHSRDDLLWAEANAVQSNSADPRPVPDIDSYSGDQNGSRTITKAKSLHAKRILGNRKSTKRPQASEQKRSRAGRSPSTRKGTYSFSLQSMLQLILGLHERESIPDEDAMALAGVKSKSGYGEYYNFLLAGGFVTRKSATLAKAAPLDDLVSSIRTTDYKRMSKFFQRVPSFREFYQKLAVGEPLAANVAGLRRDAFRTYSGLAEIACTAMRIFDQGIFATPNSPTPTQFVEPAIAAFDAVRMGEKFALTGAWLERLALNSGIHPIQARQRLAEAHQAGYIQRYFEGSTPETRYGTRTFAYVDIDSVSPSIRMMNLYYGDFLLSGRASVSIRLVAGAGK